MQNDLFEKLNIERGAFSEVTSKGQGYFTFPKLEGPLGPRMLFNGKEKIIWSLNDYLGLSTHPEVVETDKEAAANYSMAYPMGARIMSGHLNEHEQLESQLAHFVQKENAILFNYGYQGAVSAIDAILDRHDVVIYDEESHACIIDGVRLHLGKRMAFKHNDMLHLEQQLIKAVEFTQKSGGGILVISEGVFSMRGDQGKLKEIVALKPKYKFRFFVDDAHGFGVLGKTGAGTGEEQGVQEEIDFYFATFAKAMASIGAFIASKNHVIKYLYYNTRSQIFAKALPIIITLGAIKRLELIRKGALLREQMWANARTLQENLRLHGLISGMNETPITAVYMKGELDESLRVLIDIRDQFNVFCSGVIYPVVPKGIFLFRLVATAKHTKLDIEETIHAFSNVSTKLNAGFYKQV